LKRYKLPGTGQILAEFIQTGGKIYGLRSINSLVLPVIRKDFLNSGRSLSLYPFTRRVMMKLMGVIIEAYHCYQLRRDWKDI
jgi:hypothetical protein